MQILLEYTSEDIIKLFGQSYKKIGISEEKLLEIEEYLRKTIFLHRVPKAFIMIKLLKLLRTYLEKNPGVDIRNRAIILDICLALANFNILHEELPSLKKYLSPEEEQIINDFQSLKHFGELVEWADKVKRILSIENIRRRKEMLTIKKPVVYETEKYKVYYIDSFETMQILGFGTTWCTTQREHYDNYIAEGNLYVIIPKKIETYVHKNTVVQRKYLLYITDTEHIEEFTDRLDEFIQKKIEKFEFEDITVVRFREFLENLYYELKDTNSKIWIARDDEYYDEVKEEFFEKVVKKVTSKANAKFLNHIIAYALFQVMTIHEKIPDYYITEIPYNFKRFVSSSFARTIQNFLIEDEETKDVSDFLYYIYDLFNENPKLFKSVMSIYGNISTLSDEEKPKFHLWYYMNWRMHDWYDTFLNAKFNSRESPIFEFKDEQNEIPDYAILTEDLKDWRSFQNILEKLAELGHTDLKSIEGVYEYILSSSSFYEWVKRVMEFQYDSEINDYLDRGCSNLLSKINDVFKTVVYEYDNEIYLGLKDAIWMFEKSVYEKFEGKLFEKTQLMKDGSPIKETTMKILDRHEDYSGIVDEFLYILNYSPKSKHLLRPFVEVLKKTNNSKSVLYNGIAAEFIHRDARGELPS